MIVRTMLAIAALFVLATTASAEPAKRAEIAAVLERWTEDFNAGRTDKVCDLFARDLRSDYRGQPEGSYETLCAQLHRSLTDPARHYAYALAIKEILVWGDIAVVRLVWTLRLTLSPENREITTPGNGPRRLPPRAGRKMADHKVHGVRGVVALGEGFEDLKASAPTEPPWGEILGQGTDLLTRRPPVC